MIHLTRLNQIPLVINSDLIELIETTPDTVISLTTGQKFMVRETPDRVIELVIEFRREVLRGMQALSWPIRPQDQSSREAATPRLVNDGQ